MSVISNANAICIDFSLSEHEGYASAARLTVTVGGDAATASLGKEARLVLLELFVVVTVASVAYNLATADRVKPASAFYGGPFVGVDGKPVAFRRWGAQGTPVVLLGGFIIPSSVWEGVARRLATAPPASDAAFNLAAQLLAAKLNVITGAGTCPAAVSAINDSQTLLAAVHFNGITHDKLSAAQAARANSLATTLDRYNNNLLC